MGFESSNFNDSDMENWDFLCFFHAGIIIGNFYKNSLVEKTLKFPLKVS